MLLRLFDAKPGRFSDRAPPPAAAAPYARGRVQRSSGALGMGVGGTLRQRVYKDPYGLSAWDRSTATEVLLYVLAADRYALLTNRSPPPSPITAAAYAAAGIPWFELQDRASEAVSGAPALRKLRGAGKAPVGRADRAATNAMPGRRANRPA
jgi:hypothetical protein